MRGNSLNWLLVWMVLCLVSDGFGQSDQAAPPMPLLEEAAVKPIAPCSTQWADPIQKKGLPNFFKVTNELYRGAQPETEGFYELKKMGIKTIVNLRSFHSDRDAITNHGFGYEHIYAKAWHPENKEIVRFLRIATDKSRTPVFVHCQHGADRTGVMVASYWIAVCGWSTEEAINEMTRGGFGFHQMWQNLIRYIHHVDYDQIKLEAGLTPDRPSKAVEPTDMP